MPFARQKGELKGARGAAVHLIRLSQTCFVLNARKLTIGRWRCLLPITLPAPCQTPFLALTSPSLRLLLSDHLKRVQKSVRSRGRPKLVMPDRNEGRGRGREENWEGWREAWHGNRGQPVCNDLFQQFICVLLPRLVTLCLVRADEQRKSINYTSQPRPRRRRSLATEWHTHEHTHELTQIPLLDTVALYIEWYRSYA